MNLEKEKIHRQDAKAPRKDLNENEERLASSIVDGLVVLELKSVEHLLPVHHAQLLTYLKLSGLRLGFLLNFNVSPMKDGITRRILQCSEPGSSPAH